MNGTPLSYRTLAEYIDKISARFTPPTAPEYHVITVYKPGNGSCASAYDKPSRNEAMAEAHKLNRLRKHYMGWGHILRIAVLAPDGSLTDIYRYRGKK